MKKCNECKKVKPFSEFGIESRAVNGYKPRCKKCTNSYYNSVYKTKIAENKAKRSKVYYQENRKLIIEKRMEYYHANKDKIIKQHKQYIRQRKIQYPYLRTLSSFRTLVKKMMKDRNYSTFKYLEYTFDDLLNQLGGHPSHSEDIDHKIPISWFIPETELKLIFNLENLQILDSRDNRVKGNRFAHSVSKTYFDKIINHIKPKYLNRIEHD
jgi:hypothetical protein